MQNKISIAFDVNGVLTEHIFQELFKSLNRNKCHLIVWSGMDVAETKQFCKENNLIADEYLRKQSKKVDIAIDDQPEFIINAGQVLGVKQR